MMQANDTYKLIPHMGLLKKILSETEKKIQGALGIKLTITLAEINLELAVDAITKVVSDVLSVPVYRIMSDSRNITYTEARHIVFWLCKKKLPGISPAVIAEYFGKERTSVIHAFSKVENLLDVSDAAIVEKINACEAELQNRIKGE